MTVTVTDVLASAAPDAGSRPQGQLNAGQVTDHDLQSVVNALWGAGARAISVGGIRVGPQTAIRTAGQSILVAFTPVRSPYLVRAVGGAAFAAAAPQRAGSHRAGVRSRRDPSRCRRSAGGCAAAAGRHWCAAVAARPSADPGSLMIGIAALVAGLVVGLILQPTAPGLAGALSAHRHRRGPGRRLRCCPRCAGGHFQRSRLRRLVHLERSRGGPDRVPRQQARGGRPSCRRPSSSCSASASSATSPRSGAACSRPERRNATRPRRPPAARGRACCCSRCWVSVWRQRAFPAQRVSAGDRPADRPGAHPRRAGRPRFGSARPDRRPPGDALAGCPAAAPTPQRWRRRGSGCRTWAFSPAPWRRRAPASS